MTDKKQEAVSDDVFDAIAAVIIIGVVVSGVVFWLYTMPS